MSPDFPNPKGFIDFLHRRTDETSLSLGYAPFVDRSDLIAQGDARDVQPSLPFAHPHVAERSIGFPVFSGYFKIPGG
jgi:hypothetical protein